MTLIQALLYFAREAGQNLVRSWKISLVAILTIAVSLSMTGLFLLVSSNLRQVVERWQAESKIIVYFEPTATPEEINEVRDRLANETWSLGVEMVDPSAAQARFRQTFPSLGELLESWGENSLPTSLEISLLWSEVRPDALETTLRQLEEASAIDMVDADRDWLQQLETVLFILEGLALVIGLVLLATAIFTISSVIRLTAYIYQDEIAVMRLVGATEFFIRGPFYVEGLFQGLTGGITAIALLFTGHHFLIQGKENLLGGLLTQEFLSPLQVLMLITVGGLAGLIGAVTSLRKESLGQTAERPGWSPEDDSQ